MHIAPAKVPVGHSIRSGLSVGLPFVIGVLAGHVVTGMWIGLAALLLSAGEREGTYRQNFWIIAVSTPIAASGYLLGFARDLPLPALMLLTALVALGTGALAGLGPAFSVASMQCLLVAAIAIGVPHIDLWAAIGLYFVAAGIYAALLAVEMWINPRRPQRIVTVALLRSLSELAAARSSDLADGGDRTVEARRRVTSAYQAAVCRTSELSARPSWSTRVWVLDSDVLSVANRLEAYLLAETDAQAAAAAASRLAALATGVADTARPQRREKKAPGLRGTMPQGGLEVGRGHDGAAAPTTTTTTTNNSPSRRVLDSRVDDLERALHGEGGNTGRPEPLLTVSFSHEILMAACRLALCYGIAMGAKMYFPFSHWFWVPLTVCLVMKPDFGSVFSRAVLRVFGTAAGAAIATVVLLIIPKGWAIGVAIGLLSACVPSFMMRSYALQAVAIAPAVILLVDVIQPGESIENFSVERIGATIVGGVIVVVFGYLIWPHSRRVWIADTFQTALNRMADQLRLAAQPIPDDPALTRRHLDDMTTARRAAFRALSDLQFRLRRALAEPGVAGRTATAWIPVVSSADRLADAVTAYAVHRRTGVVPAAPDNGAELAAEISALGRGPDHPHPEKGAGPAGRDGSGPGEASTESDSGPDSDHALAQVREEFAHLESLMEPASEQT